MHLEAANEKKAGGTVPLVGRSPGAFVLSGIGPRIMLAPPDEAPPAAPPAGDPPPDSNSNSETPPTGDTPPAPPSRPEYIPESFWDAEKGFKTDDFNSLVAFKAEHDANLAQVPADKDGYEVKLPQDFKLPDGFELPEGKEAIIDADDPRVGHLREYAIANKLSQAQFETMLALGAQMDIAEQGRMQEAIAAQAEKLGANGKARIDAVTTWLGAKLGGELAGAIAPMLMTANQIKAFEAIMRLNRGTVPGDHGGGRDDLGGSQKIEGYENMNFRQRMAAIDAMKTR